MRKIINHLRSQPDETKRHVVHLTTFIFTVFLVLIWIFTLGTTLGGPETQKGVAKDVAPFASLKDNVTAGYQDYTNPDANTQTDPNADLKAQEDNL